MRRLPALSQFYECAYRAIENVEHEDPATPGAARRIFTALESPSRVFDTAEREVLPSCRHLPVAISNAHRGPMPIAALAEAFERLEPSLSWWRRPDAHAHGETFSNGHANTYIAGPAGFEQRSDVIIGASLMAPDVEYPHHSHPPEELYVVMSDGDWYNEHVGWYTPGMGAIVYHEPSVTHGMRSHSQPLLAIWCLWAG